MNAKCPVCDYVIEKGIEVKVGNKTVTVCCEDCAAKLRKEQKAKTSK